MYESENFYLLIGYNKDNILVLKKYDIYDEGACTSELAVKNTKNIYITDK